MNDLKSRMLIILIIPRYSARCHTELSVPYGFPEKDDRIRAKESIPWTQAPAANAISTNSKIPENDPFSGDWRKHEERKTLAALVDEDGSFAA